MPKPGLRLLLVEDTVPVLAILRASLQSAGFQVDTARTAAEAMAQLVVRRYAAIITDCDLADLSPLDWLAAIRGAAPGTPLVAYTASIRVHEVRELARDWGAVTVLSKPFSPAQLVGVVRTAAARQPNGG
jgi:DNA-binding response OmpR family regulator